MDLGLQGKRAIVLGGSRGIGFYTAKLLLEEGADVALCARGEDGVRQAVAALQTQDESADKAHGGKVYGAAADLEDEQATRQFVRDAISELGGVDVLVHNASGFGMADDEGDWLRSFQVDVMAGVRAVQEALPALKESTAPAITFVGSMASKFHFGRPVSPYGAAKGAVRVYANELAQNYGRHGIRANVVSPGAVWFPGGRWDERKQADPKFYAQVEKAIPLGRLGTGEEMARIIAFVSSPAGIWINGAHIAADGGQVAAVD